MANPPEGFLPRNELAVKGKVQLDLSTAAWGQTLQASHFFILATGGTFLLQDLGRQPRDLERRGQDWASSQ